MLPPSPPSPPNKTSRRGQEFLKCYSWVSETKRRQVPRSGEVYLWRKLLLESACWIQQKKNVCIYLDKIIFIPGLLIIPQKQKQNKFPTMRDSLNKWWYVCAGKYCATITKRIFSLGKVLWYIRKCKRQVTKQTNLRACCILLHMFLLSLITYWGL